ncbi:MAG: DUF4105 domain-containing protein [Cyclobacteriaceae bacterium]|nr:DUF4105 domain-containing protein [Cyclobacteriaceae bacterium]
MKKALTLVFLFCTSSGWCQSIILSPQAEISVITCGPGADELYSAFGHSAIRIQDPANNINYAYNYGVFDFDQPNFYLNYTKGLLLFKLGVYAYPDFVKSYVYYNRWVTEQVLDLSPQQKQKIFDFLEWNALPENETYRYDYFYNNCANKVRDVFVEQLGDSIQFDGSYVTTHYSLRDLTDIYLVDQPWGDLGIDICLGLPIDKKATPYEYMYLPDYVLSGFDHATISRNGQAVPIVKQKISVFVNKPREVTPAPVHPWTIFGGFLFLTILLSLYDAWRKRVSLWFDVILFVIVGAVGVLLLLLWTATDHAAAANNFNLVWALPTNLFILGVLSSRTREMVRKYFLGVAILELILLVTWSFVPQHMNIFLIPFVAALLIRAIVIYRWLPPTTPVSQTGA